MNFDLPTDFITTATGYVGDVFSGYGVLIALAVGIPLAFYVIRKVMSLMPGK